MRYFAYGSNMSVLRLRQRVPSAQVLGLAVLHGHRLMFHKAGRDGSAKCDATVSVRDKDVVHGVLYRMDPAHKSCLDNAEGLGRGYAQKTVEVSLTDGGSAFAITYYATSTNPALKPYSWYLEHVLRGARENGLPTDYVAEIAATDTIFDPDPERNRAELAIYI